MIQIIRADALPRAAREFMRRRKTPPMTQAEYDAVQVDLDPTGDIGQAIVDYDLESIRLLEEEPRKLGRLPEKKLRKLQRDILASRYQDGRALSP